MKIIKVFLRFLIVVVVFTMLTVAPGSTHAVQAQANTVIYNLYATDTFIALADGTVLYNYGFVGGRQGVPLTFQNSMMAAVNPGGVTTLAGGAPAPTGGPITAAEMPLLGNAQFPAPLIYATAGDIVEIRFKNLGVANPKAPNDPHSIHLHGLDVNAANDGVPETSVGAVPANLVGAKGVPIPGAGNVIVYMFSPQFAGSYMYHCHQEADIHVQMGMYGALVVYNPGDAASTGGPGTGSGDLFGWKYDKDVVLLLSEIDVNQHLSELGGATGLAIGATFNPVNYHPQYWFINGLSFPNTIHANGAVVNPFNWTNWIAAHPGYDPLVVGSVSAPSFSGTPGQKVLLRVINMGFETQPMHMHGFHAKILGSDQRAWYWANPAGTPTNQGLEKNTLTIGSGETYEWLIDFSQQQVASTYANGSGGLNGTFAGGTQSRVGPSSNTNGAAAIPVPGLIPSATYIGGPAVTGAIGIPMASQLFPFHNHDDYKATNNGVYPGGMFTMIIPVP